MGTPLTGSTVASTYTGLLKTTDNATLTSTLKSLSDGGGNDSALQVSTTAVNSIGDFSVATNKLTVASASGNTAVAGTLNVTGAATLSSTLNVTGATTVGSLSTSGNISTSAGNISASAGTISSYGAISQTQSGQNNSLAGNLSVGGNLNVTGVTTFTGNLQIPGNLGVTGDFAVNTNKFTVAASSGDTVVAGTLGVTGLSTLGTLSVTGASTLASASITGAATVGTTLGVTGNTTLSADLAVNGNTTIGNASGDSLTVTAGAVTINNLPSKTTPVDADTVLLRDSAASNALKTASVSTLGVVKFVYSEGFSKAGGGGQTIAITAGGGGYAIQEGGSPSDWTYTWSPKTIGNKALIRISVPVEVSVQGSVYIGVAKSPYNVPADYIGVGAAYASAAAASPVNVIADMVFTSTAASHIFKIFITSATQTVVIARNSAGYYFGQTGSTLQAKVQFELIEYA